MLGTLLFIIFGWPERQKEHGLVAPSYCDHCNNESDFHLVKTRRWLSVFFIPVLPLGRAQYYLVCNICAMGVEIDREFAGNCKAMAGITRQHLAGEIGQAEYQRELEAFDATFRQMPTEPEADTDTESGTEPETEFETESEAESEYSDAKYCKKCGEEVFAGHDYCRDCHVEMQLDQSQ